MKKKLHPPLLAHAMLDGMRFIFLFIFAFMAMSFSAQAQAPLVVDFFTTRACSSCPPVDAMMKRVVEAQADENLIFLGCHATYFNYGGANDDALARKFCDDRQGAYLAANVLKEIYTPQAVLNGWLETPEKEAEEGDAAVFRRALEAARAQRQPAPIALRLQGEELEIRLPEIAFANTVELWLFAYDKLYSEKGAAGLKADDVIEYINVVTYLKNLGGPISGRQVLAGMEADSYAVIAQDSASMRIMAAGEIERN